MQETIRNILRSFSPISLDDMDRVALMNRTDTKFLLRAEQLPILLEELKDHYTILRMNGLELFRYESLYFDTRDFHFYQQHQRGKLNRYKFRYRNYVESASTYFEIKLKNNKGRTVKRRVKVPGVSELIEGKAAELLARCCPELNQELEKKLWTNFYRITLVGKQAAERVTLDLELELKNDSLSKHFPTLVIAEVKRDRSQHSAFLQLMRRHHIREASFSKYCLGVISLFGPVKHNSFKSKLNYLNKLIYAAA